MIKMCHCAAMNVCVKTVLRFTCETDDNQNQPSKYSNEFGKFYKSLSRAEPSLVCCRQITTKDNFVCRAFQVTYLMVVLYCDSINDQFDFGYIRTTRVSIFNYIFPQCFASTHIQTIHEIIKKVLQLIRWVEQMSDTFCILNDTF